MKIEGKYQLTENRSILPDPPWTIHRVGGFTENNASVNVTVTGLMSVLPPHRLASASVIRRSMYWRPYACCCSAVIFSQICSKSALIRSICHSTCCQCMTGQSRESQHTKYVPFYFKKQTRLKPLSMLTCCAGNNIKTKIKCSCCKLHNRKVWNCGQVHFCANHTLKLQLTVLCTLLTTKAELCIASIKFCKVREQQ